MPDGYSLVNPETKDGILRVCAGNVPELSANSAPSWHRDSDSMKCLTGLQAREPTGIILGVPGRNARVHKRLCRTSSITKVLA